jgi:signal transduction histidine kinase
MHIVNDILDFSKLKLALALEITNTDIYELTKVVDLFKWQATNNKIDLELNIDYAVSLYPSGEKEKQILKLLSYILKFTNTRKISLIYLKTFSKDSFTINFS